VHTLALPITNKLADLYATADVQAITTLLTKMGKSYIDRSTALAFQSTVRRELHHPNFCYIPFSFCFGLTMSLWICRLVTLRYD